MRGRDPGQDQDLMSCFGVMVAPSFTTHAPGGDLSVTRILCDVQDNGLSNPLPREDAWLLTIQLRACPTHELWIDDRPQPTGPLPAGAVSIYDLRRDPRVNSISPFANLHFRLPMAALNAIGEQSGFGAITMMPDRPGLGLADGVISGLGTALAPLFEQPERANPLFVDHVTHALASYVAQRFSSRRAPSRSDRRLSVRQRQIVDELLDQPVVHGAPSTDLDPSAANMVGNAVREGIRNTAAACPSRSSPIDRVEKALDLIRGGRVSMDDVALRCGFADVAHLLRVIAAYGPSPRFVRH